MYIPVNWHMYSTLYCTTLMFKKKHPGKSFRAKYFIEKNFKKLFCLFIWQEYNFLHKMVDFNILKWMALIQCSKIDDTLNNKQLCKETYVCAFSTIFTNTHALHYQKFVEIWLTLRFWFLLAFRKKTSQSIFSYWFQ